MARSRFHCFLGLNLHYKRSPERIVFVFLFSFFRSFQGSKIICVWRRPWNRKLAWKLWSVSWFLNSCGHSVLLFIILLFHPRSRVVISFLFLFWMQLHESINEIRKKNPETNKVASQGKEIIIHRDSSQSEGPLQTMCERIFLVLHSRQTLLAFG